MELAVKSKIDDRESNEINFFREGQGLRKFESDPKIKLEPNYQD
jgi:hypothetical protein